MKKDRLFELINYIKICFKSIIIKCKSLTLKFWVLNIIDIKLIKKYTEEFFIEEILIKIT